MNAPEGRKIVPGGKALEAAARSWHFPDGEARPPLPVLLNVTHLVRRAPEPGLHPRRNAHWGLDYHFAAAGAFSLDGRTWRPREAGTAHLYAPGTPYWERSRPRDLPFTETYVLFRAGSEPVLDALAAPGRGFARFRDESGALADVFRALLGSGPEGNRRWRSQAALLGLLDGLASARPTGGGEFRLPGAGEAPPDSLAARVDAFIRAHYDEPLTLADMARAAGVSRSTLTHRYAAEAGETPFGRLAAVRLDVARGLLLKGERAKAVAHRTGFADEYHFSKAFKRRFGLPPRQYGKQPAPDAGGPRLTRRS